MPDRQSRPARICPGCDGFPVVAITTGVRNRDGSRRTIPAHCPACNGHGHTHPVRKQEVSV